MTLTLPPEDEAHLAARRDLPPEDTLIQLLAEEDLRIAERDAGSAVLEAARQTPRVKAHYLNTVIEYNVILNTT